MSRSALDLLRSEIGTLEQFLADLTDDDVIERLGLEHRLSQARERLAAVEGQPQPKPLPMTFRGRPVDGSRSIDATFASKAVKAFVEATDTVAASLVEDLKGRGRLPGTTDRSLRIIDTARGSFGFELELPPPQAIEPTQAGLFPAAPEPIDPYADAITTTLKLLDQAATEDEDAISDLVAEVHPRAAAKVRAFAKVLNDHEALFAVAFEGRQVRLDTEAQVRRVVDSLADEDISENNETHAGTLLGVLPESRAFEARLTDGAIIHGKIDRAVHDIIGFKAQWEGNEASLALRVIRVRANRRFVLTGAIAGPADDPGP